MRSSEKTGAATTSGRPVATQWPTALAKHHRFERHAGEEQLVERAIVAIVLEQAVEAEEGREQSTDPQDRRADPGEER